MVMVAMKYQKACLTFKDWWEVYGDSRACIDDAEEAWKAGAAAEREACAKLADGAGYLECADPHAAIADLIRERGQKET